MTAQLSEIIIVDGDQRRMQFCPELPDNSPHVVPNPNPESVESSTACWRGYLGVWEIEGDRFYLKEIRPPHGEGLAAFLFESPERLHATWFSGVLRLPHGQLMRYVHMGFASVFEEEDHIKIERGVVVGRHRIDNRTRLSDGRREGSLGFPGTENRFDGDDW